MFNKIKLPVLNDNYWYYLTILIDYRNINLRNIKYDLPDYFLGIHIAYYNVSEEESNNLIDDWESNIVVTYTTNSIEEVWKGNTYYISLLNDTSNIEDIPYLLNKILTNELVDCIISNTILALSYKNLEYIIE